MAEIKYIPVSKLWRHPDNPRKDLGDVTELAESIKVNGVLQNLTVVPLIGEITKKWDGESYRVIIGHRRLAAAKLAGLEELPCVVVEMSEREQLSTMLTENMQRSDLTVYEQAQGFQLMLNLGDSIDEIARKSGFSQTTVRRRVKLLELDRDKFRSSVDRGATLQDYMELDKISDKDLKNEVLDAIGTKNFRSKLQAAIDCEKQRKYADDTVAMLSEFATQITEVDRQKHQYIRNFSSWNKNPFEMPADAGTSGYYYRVGVHQVDLYADRDEAPDDREAERLMEQEHRKLRRGEMIEVTGRAHQLRRSYIAAYSAAKKNTITLIRTACRFCLEQGFNSMNHGLLAALLNISYDCENEGFPTDAYEEKLSAHTEYTLLATLYASIDGEYEGYWTEIWNAELGRYVIAKKANEPLDNLYAFLEELGYEMSDDEKALQDGSHELFQEVTDE